MSAPRRARILLIDDDPDIHLAVEMMLVPLGYELTCYSTGAAGLEALRREPPDLLLLDIMLTQPTEGLQIACEIRQDVRIKSIPIIFISAVSKAAEAEYAREVCPVSLDAEQFIEKPLHTATVREAVQQVLARKPADIVPPS